MKKTKIGILVFLFSLLAIAGLGNAAISTDYAISAIEVNGIVSTVGGNSVRIERGQTADIDVWITGTGNIDDIKMKTWIGGYEYEDIEDVTKAFDVETGVEDKKSLRLSIPDDIDASQTYTLYVEIYDKNNYVRNEYDLRIKESRHQLNIQDILLRPGSTVEVGKPLFVTVRVENVGSQKEEDIKVSVKIPELGLSSSNYIDELVAIEDDDDDEETSASSDELYLRIPSDAISGEYDLVIEVISNRGHNVIKETKTVIISGGLAQLVQTLISVDTTSQNIAKGEGAVYKVMFANLGATAKAYSIQVSGTGTWASARVDPASTAVAPGTSGEVYVYLTANPNADLGKHVFTIKAMSGTTVLKEIGIEANVVGSSSGWSNVKKALEIGFVVLLIVLVILGLIVAFGKIKNKEGEGLEPEEPLTEGQTYY